MTLLVAGAGVCPSLHWYKRREVLTFAAEVFRSVGMRVQDADIMGDALVDAEERGIVTHGLVRLPAYLQQLTLGDVKTRPVEQVLVARGAVALIDADGGFGAPVGVRAVTRAVKAAYDYGVGLVSVRRVAHFGAASYYARLAAAAGCYGIAMSSTSAVVAPWGGAEPRIGNNPLAVATPTIPGKSGLVLDIAMSAVSRGQIKLAQDRGETIPRGWAVDERGEPTTDPLAALSGALLPMGGHKGSGLAIAIEMLAAALSGAQLSQDTRHGGFTPAPRAEGQDSSLGDVTVGNVYLAISADAFGDAYAAIRRNERILDHVRSCPPVRGTDRVLVPGDKEAERVRAFPAGLLGLSSETTRALGEAAKLSAVKAPDEIPENAC